MHCATACHALDSCPRCAQDLLLIHWPGVSRTLADSPLNAQLRFQTWQVRQALHAAGVRHADAC